MNRQSPTSLLLATDRLASPLLEAGATVPSVRAAYTPYGYRPGGPEGMKSRMGFTGQLREPEIGWYMLGNGHRAFNPILMRFHSPDRLSPFGEGGINSYAYCRCDPVNMHDPTGQVPGFIAPIITLFTNLLGGVSTYFSAKSLIKTHQVEAPDRRVSGAGIADTKLITTRRRDIAVSSAGGGSAAIGAVTSVMNLVDNDLSETATYMGYGATTISVLTTMWQIYQSNQKRPWEQGPALTQIETISSPQTGRNSQPLEMQELNVSTLPVQSLEIRNSSSTTGDDRTRETFV